MQSAPNSNPFLGVSTLAPFPGTAVFAPPTEAPAPTAAYLAPRAESPDIDDASNEAVEIKVLWGQSVLQVVHLTSGQSFHIGDSADQPCDFTLPSERLGRNRVPLVALTEGGATLLVPPRAVVAMHVHDARWQMLDDLLAARTARASSEIVDAHEVDLPSGARACVRLAGSDVSFEIARVQASRPVPAGVLAALDPASHAYTGLSAALHLALVVSFAFFMPAMTADAAEGVDRDQLNAMLHYLNASAEPQPDPRTDDGSGETATSGGTGSRAPGEEGAAGTPLAKPANARFAVHGPADNPSPEVARERALHEIATSGMVGMIASDLAGDPRAPVNPWSTHDEARGNDPKSALGNMWGDEIGDAFGTGIGLSGTGQGGGCENGSCQGIGMGNVGTVGHGNGLHDGQGIGPGGWGSGHGPLKGGHDPQFRMPRPGKIDVGGKLPAEVIQRIVRQNFGRFRMCYEDGLRTNPNLQGRVAIKFVIDHDGGVAMASDAGSDLPDQGVVQCIVRGFGNLSFPQPQGGIVKVVYPFQLVPGE
jgi:hypothetical protein